MSKLKKVLLMCTAYVMVAALAVAGTLAYFTWEDSDVNVMTVGNVQIDLIEQQRTKDSTALEDFEQGKTLLPLVGSAQGEKDKFGLPTAGNYVDKIVSIKNTGKSDAYVRVVVAVPAGLENSANAAGPLHWNFGNHFSADGTYVAGSSNPGYSDIVFAENGQGTIDEISYNLYSFTYKTALKPGETTECPAFVGFYLNSSVDFDGTNYTFNGAKIDFDFSNGVAIPVMAQAVQSDGFDTAEKAFQNANMPTNPWVGGVSIPATVSDTEEFVSALQNGETNLLLVDDVVLTEDVTVIDHDITINLNGHSITSDRGVAGNGNTAKELSTLYISGANVVIEGEGDVINSAADAAYSITVDNGAKVTIKSGNYISYHDAIYVKDGELYIEGGFFQATADTEAEADYTHPNYPNEPKSHTAIVINCNKDAYINAKSGTSYSGGITAKVVITGGTFVNEDPSNIFEGWYINDSYVADGYKVVAEPQANGDIWYTVVSE